MLATGGPPVVPVAGGFGGGIRGGRSAISVFWRRRCVPTLARRRGSAALQQLGEWGGDARECVRLGGADA